LTLPEKEETREINSFRIKPDPDLADRLNSLIIEGDIHKTRWREIWPQVQLVSCWTNAWAAPRIPFIQSALKNFSIQGKGLLSTEGAVTIPIMGMHLPAYFSHFFEFIDMDTQQIKLLSELEIDKTYEVIITTGSGLYRYKLNDLVKVSSFFNQLPNLAFMGKSNIVSDLVGEKLSELSVSIVLNNIRGEFNLASDVFFLSPCIAENTSFYALYTDDETISPTIIERIDEELHKVFYYAQARGLNQLRKPRIYYLSRKGVVGYTELFTSKNVKGTSKFFALNRLLNLFEKLDGKFIN
jgi:hypothetical protein